MSTTTTKPLSPHAQCAKDIRAELKRRFPGPTFRVRSESYAGGNSVDIAWDFGPTTRQVDAVTKKYQHGDFDGMTDSYNYAKTTTPSSAKYVQTQRSTPQPIYEHMCRDYAELLGEPIPDGCPVWNHRMQKWGDSITTLMNRLESCFALPKGYQGIRHVPEGTETYGRLEDFYELIGGIRQPRE